MGKILLDYAFSVSEILPIPAPSTAFLKQVGVVCKPKEGVEPGSVTLCTSKAAVAALTDNRNADQLFDAGMSRCYVVLSETLDLEELLDANPGLFFTLLISDDFEDGDLAEVVTTAGVKAQLKIQDVLFRAQEAGADGNAITVNYDSGASDGEAVVSVDGSAITVQIEDGVTTAETIAEAIEESEDAAELVEAIVDEGDEDDAQAVFGAAVNLAGGVTEVLSAGDGISAGTFKGVIGVAVQDAEIAADQAVIQKRCAFLCGPTHKAKNMFYAFGSLLANAVNWLNQQYIQMPFSDGITQLGQAEAAFDPKLSFVITDDEFGNRLAMFAAGGQAIVAPYIVKNLIIDSQGRALQYIAANQPDYSVEQATLLESAIQKDIVQKRYIERRWIRDGKIDIRLEQDNFVASGYIDIAEPKALWRVFNELRQTL
jgi:predicted RNase H-like HicB family nuclease